MALWKRSAKPTSTEAGPEALPAADPSGLDAGELLDTIASLLRTEGELAIPIANEDRDAVRDVFESWARHTLVGSPPPGALDGSDTAERDWLGMLRFFDERRRSESESVSRSLDDLRDTLWVFIQGLGRVVPEDRESDASIGEQLVRLRECIDSSDTDKIKREALSSIGFIERTLSDRRERSETLIDELSTRVREISHELTEARERLEVDALTGLFNRAALDQRLEQLVQLAELTGRAPTVYMIDLDHFKWVNDHFGHAAGDHVLRAVASCLRRTFADPGHFVARYGGDEFCALASTDGHEADAALGEAAVANARDLEIRFEDEPIRVGLSIGAARRRPGEDVGAWMERADRALYRSKEQGRDRFEQAEG